MEKLINTWNLNNMLLNNPWGKEAITREIRKYLEVNKNENATHQDSQDAAEAALTGKLTL